MNRRETLATLGACAATSTLPAAVSAAEAALRPRPNILLIVVDDLRHDEFGAGGHPYLKTPNIDRVAREGATFASMFHATPLCSPNRASILTGEFAARHGIYGNVSREQSSHALRTLTKHLHAGGYETGHVGKWHMGDSPKPRPGYDYWVSFPAQGKIQDPDLWEDGRLHRVEGYVTDILTDRAATFLRKRDRAKPFFLYVGHKAVHPDVVQRNDGSLDLAEGMHYGAAPRHAGRYAAQVYERAPSARGPIPERPKSRMVEHMLALQSAPDVQAEFGSIIDPGTSEDTIRARAEMMLAVDESVGALLAELEAAGDLDSTVVIFTSDNGFFFGEHGLSIERRLPYEEAIRMPVLLRYPPAARPSAVVRELGSSTDIAPTILDLAGMPVPAHMQGRSLRAALDGRTVAAGRTGILIEHYSHDFPMPWAFDADYRALRTARYKYVQWSQHPEFAEMYDLRTDPHEVRNLAGAAPKVEAELKRRLAELVAQSLGLDQRAARSMGAV